MVNEINQEESKGRKKSKLYDWRSRSPVDCVKDLITLCDELIEELQERYNRIIPNSVKKLGVIFDMENIMTYLSNFKIESGKHFLTRDDRQKWDLFARDEFQEFYEHVCNLPHIQKFSEENPELELQTHNSSSVLKNFKTTVRDIIWGDLGNVSEYLFRSPNGEIIEEFKESKLTNIEVLCKPSINQWFSLEFASGLKFEATLIEEAVVASMYNCSQIYRSMGKEACIALDVALASGGCEAIVEGFYSVMKTHKKCGGQSNKTLVHRAVVDWCLPNVTSCPKTIKAIAKLHAKGNTKLGVSAHRSALLTDFRGRTTKSHNVSKVVDRLSVEVPRCPHVVNLDK